MIQIPALRFRAFWAVTLAVLMGTLILDSARCGAQMLRERKEIAKLLTVDKVNYVGAVVSGEVVNRSPHAMREVQLFIRYTWLWDNETKPGANDPGTSAYYTLPKEIPPGGRLPFTFEPSPPLAKMAGGRFETSVAIAGFTEIIPQTR